MSVGWGEKRGPTPMELWERKAKVLADALTAAVKKHEESPTTNNIQAMHKAADKCIDHILEKPEVI